MPLQCPRCSRLSPQESRFCHFDGQLLDSGLAGAAVNPASRDFLVPFTMPNGATCRNFDQLARGCLNHWEQSRELLRKGTLASFLGNIGRADLALAAQEAARYPDPDRGLDQFIRKLPAQNLPPPDLAIEPFSLNLGEHRGNKDFTARFRVRNRGLGLLYGTVRIDNCPWLSLGDGANHKVFQTADSAEIVVQVRPRFLRAGLKPQIGKLLVESNGGTHTLDVTILRPVTPFPEGVLAGAKTPRELATKAKASPKAAAVLFEKGVVARWYSENGWDYPLRTDSSTGLGAVQQFFEALGLVKAPVVKISTERLVMSGDPNEEMGAQVWVETPEKRPVWALARSNVPWLAVGKVKLDGRKATIPLRIPSTPNHPGETLYGYIDVTANGNQRFRVEVELSIKGTSRSMGWHVIEGVSEEADLVPVVLLEPEPATRPAPRIPERPARSEKRERDKPERPKLTKSQRRMRRLLPFAPVAFLALGLLITLVHDMILWGQDAPSEWLDDPNPKLDLAFHDHDERVQFGNAGFKPSGGGGGGSVSGTWEASMRFGLVVKQEANPDGGRKRLTMHESGWTNNTCLQLDGNEWLFGESPYRVGWSKEAEWPGKWRKKSESLGRAPWGKRYEGRKSSWEYPDQKVVITQTVCLIPGPQSGKLDTCLVRYRIDNEDSKPHKVGLRFLLDTYIGGNDGVPFLIPGQRELCTTSQEFPNRETVPVYIQACEREDLRSPGTMARVQFKGLGFSLEEPDRVTLGAWPNLELASRDGRCKQMRTMWDVPVFPLRTLSPGDSCVVIYWNPRDVPAGGSREVGFTYGLGSLASGEGNGQLALSCGGTFTPKGEIHVTAQVRDPRPNQTVTLQLPEGWELLEGTAKQSVPQGTGVVPITWRVRAPSSEGSYNLRVESNRGATQTQPVKIRAKNIFG